MSAESQPVEVEAAPPQEAAEPQPQARVEDSAHDQPEPTPEDSHIGSSAFANEIFNLIGHEDVADITLLQADMCVHNFGLTCGLILLF